MTTKRKPIFLVFWGLLLYISAALIWWFFLLSQQNHDISQSQLQLLKYSQDSLQNPIEYALAKQKIIYKETSRNKKYIGEGLTFLILIIIGAILVFRMAIKQFKLATQQQNFMMAVTHELKTPISVAQINLQTLKKYELTIEKQHKLLDNTLKETRRLDQLASNILIASKLDAGGYTKVEDDIAIDKLVADRMHNFQENYTSHHFITEVKEECTIQGDQFLVEIVVDNLLSNAIKYSKANTTITAQIFRNGFAIIDQGKGISNNDKKIVFNKFVRLGNEDTRNAKGTGIGLYLCNRIVKDLKGNITITDNQPNGSIFTVLL